MVHKTILISGDIEIANVTSKLALDKMITKVILMYHQFRNQIRVHLVWLIHCCFTYVLMIFLYCFNLFLKCIAIIFLCIDSYVSLYLFLYFFIIWLLMIFIFCYDNLLWYCECSDINPKKTLTVLGGIISTMILL